MTKSSEQRGTDIDYVVVGAGFSGLSAAKVLIQAGASVVVLEARSDIGGRSQNILSKAGCPVEIGGQFITKVQSNMIALSREYGLTLYTPYGGSNDPDDIDLGPEWQSTIDKLETLCNTVSTEVPWDAPNADELDKISLHQWLLNNASDRNREIIASLAEGYFAVPVWTVSLLHFLFYARGNGGVNYLVGAEGDPRNQLCISGGTQQLATGMAQDLGDIVRLDEAVSAIEHNSTHVNIQSRSTVIRAKGVVIAMPPHVTRLIRFDPPLNPMRDHLAQRVPIGSGYKISAVYETPFWRHEAAEGEDQTSKLGFGIFDNSPYQGRQGILTTFPPILDSWEMLNLSEPERRELILASFAEVVGEEALSPIDYIEKKWAEEPYIRGEVSVFPPGAWTMFGKALRKPIGRIFWAGTETATEFPGQLEGAIRAGKRAAAELLALANET